MDASINNAAKEIDLFLPLNKILKFTIIKLKIPKPKAEIISNLGKLMGSMVQYGETNRVAVTAVKHAKSSIFLAIESWNIGSSL